MGTLKAMEAAGTLLVWIAFSALGLGAPVSVTSSLAAVSIYLGVLAWHELHLIGAEFEQA